MKKFLSFGLSVLIILSVFTSALPLGANAADGKYTENGFVYEINGDKAIITGYEGDEKYLNIYAELENGCTVTAIGDGAFSGNLNLLSLSCNAELESVGDYAFEACSHLKTVNFSGALGSVGKGTFSDCTSLESVSLNKNVRSIGDGAFLFDKKLDGERLSEVLKKFAEGFRAAEIRFRVQRSIQCDYEQQNKGCSRQSVLRL